MTLIYVNGDEKTVEEINLTYEQIVRLVFGDIPSGLNPSVIYKRGAGNKSGILHVGQSVEVVDGLKISAAITGNA
jgi:hypothetical protein